LFRPLRLVRDREGFATSGAEQRIFAEETTKRVMDMLIDVVDGDGTGSRARIAGLRVAGKTGTAQKADRGAQGGYGDKRMASFAGIVPANNPRYVILVMLDEPSITSQYGGVLAAPVFQKVASRIMAYGGYLPDVIFATRQPVPAAPPRASSGGTVSASAETMPDVRGKSLRRAMEILAPYGMVPNVRGEGLTVLRQEPAPGAPSVAEGDPLPCTLWLSEETAPGTPVATASPALPDTAGKE
jgi:cell division protein FtsI (penicillin-binding protein 3)